MRRLLFVVDRDRPDLLARLRADFADTPEVAVIYDRRVADRRREPRTLMADDRRHRERGQNRTEPDPLGWVLLRISSGDGDP